MNDNIQHSNLDSTLLRLAITWIKRKIRSYVFELLDEIICPDPQYITISIFSYEPYINSIFELQGGSRKYVQQARIIMNTDPSKIVSEGLIPKYNSILTNRYKDAWFLMFFLDNIHIKFGQAWHCLKNPSQFKQYTLTKSIAYFLQ